MRSLLVVPGGSRSALDAGLGCGADALIVDLGSTVAPAGRAEARRVAAGFLAEAAGREWRPLLFVRIDALGIGLADDDLLAAMPAGPDGIVLPGAVGARDVQHLAAKLAVAEAEHGLADGRTRILPVATDTAAGVLAIGTVPGASPRLAGIAWDGDGLSADIGADADRDTPPCRHARTMTLLAAAAAGLDAVDFGFADSRDADGLARECRDARRDGFMAKLATHPDQIPVINEAFTPSPAALDEARAVAALFAADPGARFVEWRGRTLDRSHGARAERLLARNAAVARLTDAHET